MTNEPVSARYPLLLVLAGAMLVTACAPTGPLSQEDDITLRDDATTTTTFNRNRIIEDAELFDTAALTAPKIDAFLARPYPAIDNQASCLAGETFGGKSVGTLVMQTAKKYGLSPLFLLTHLQKESSLIGNTASVCPAADLEAAFGCGCPDGGGCDPQYAGFTAQLDCAGSLTRSYLDDLATKGSTISGWKVGGAKTTSDGYSITPTGKAAAVLYTYTPWVGDRTAGGNAAPFGNYLFWKNWTGYAKTLGYTGPQTGSVTPSNATCQTDADCPSGSSCNQSGSSWACMPAKQPIGGACSKDADCTGGLAGQGVVCGASSHVCLAGCHQDADCQSGNTCDHSQSPWACAAPQAQNPIGASITASYDPAAAVAYADAHWNDGKGLCAEFVSDAAVSAGHLGLGYSTWVPTIYADLTSNNVPFDEYTPSQTSVRACPGDIVIDSNDAGSGFCVEPGGTKNCGHIGLVVVGGKSVNTILANYHNGANYHSPIGNMLSTTALGTYVGAYSTLRVYHLVNCEFY